MADQTQIVYYTGTITYRFNEGAGSSWTMTETVSIEEGETFNPDPPSYEYYEPGIAIPSSSFTVTGDFSVTYSYMRIRVTCTKNRYYDGVAAGSETETLLAGYTFTPEAHIPSYNSDYYDFNYCSPNGAMTCPTYDFSVDYYFIQARVYGEVVLYYDDVSQGRVDSDYFTIDAIKYVSNYMPSYDSSHYKFDHAGLYNWSSGVETILGSTFTVPSSNFSLNYYFIKKCTPYIYATKNGITKWWPATAYIYKNSSEGWVEAQPFIYDNNQWN